MARLAVSLLFILSVILLSSQGITATRDMPGSASPWSQAGTLPPQAHADRDGNGLSDALEHKILGRAANERIEVVVTFDGPGNAISAQNSVGSFRFQHNLSTVRGFLATMTVGQARALASTPGVFRVEENFEVTAVMAEARADYRANAAQLEDYDGAGIGVCVIDTGLDGDHIDLAGKIDRFCNALTGGCNINADGLAVDNTVPFDDHYHGTHVGGIAAGAGIGNPDYLGVAPEARLYGAKALDSGGSGTEANIERAIGWCAGQAGVHVLNLSIGTLFNSDGNSAIELALDCAVDQNSHASCLYYPQRTPKVAVVAAGNSGPAKNTVGAPGGSRNAITVGALGSAAVTAEWVDSHGYGLAAFSSRGPTADDRIKPDIVAPGTGITAPSNGTGNGYRTLSGTSMAAPYTAGTAALMIQAFVPGGGSLSVAQAKSIKTMLTATAQDTGPTGQDIDWGWGSIDTLRAVRQAEGAADPGPNPFATTEYYNPEITDNTPGWTHDIVVTEANLSSPVLVTILNPSARSCLLPVGNSCWWWVDATSDFDAEITDSEGNIIDMSRCVDGENGLLPDPSDPSETYCGYSGEGRQETLFFVPEMADTYMLRVYPWNGDALDDTDSAVAEVVIARSSIAGSEPPPSNTAPLASDVADTTDEDISLSVILSATDPEQCELGFSIVGGPAHGTLTPITDEGCATGYPNGDTATVIYTPPSDLYGSDFFTYKVNDGSADSNDATVSITIKPVNDAPVAETLSSTTNEGTPVTVVLRATDIEECELGFSIVSGPAHGTLGSINNQGCTTGNPKTDTATVTYIPDGGYSGPDSFTYQANDDSVDSNVATVSITVNPMINNPPQADAGSDQTHTLEEGLVVYLDGNGSLDPEGTALSYYWEFVSVPKRSKATLQGDTTAMPSFAPDKTGDYQVQLTVTDSEGASDSDTVVITIKKPPKSGGGGDKCHPKRGC